MLRPCRTAQIAFLGLVCLAALPAIGDSKVLPLPDHPRYAIEHFGERFGLGAVTVTAMAQDQKGFLWIGTETGIFRYDGTEVKHFGRKEGLPGELVDLILVAPDGTLWVRTRNGISRLNRETFETISLSAEAGALRDVHQSFAVDSQGRLFVSTQRGLLRVDPDGSTHNSYQTDAALGSIQIDAVVRAPDDTIWFASGRHVARVLPGSQTIQACWSLNLGDEQVVALLFAPDQKLWFRSSRRIGFVDTKNLKAAPEWLDSRLPEANSMGGPSLDRQGNLLLPTYQGLYRRIGSGWKLIDHNTGLTSSAVVSALEDSEGGIWIGTAGAGLDHWAGSHQWSGWTDADGLPDALVLGVVRDSRSRLWVGTNTALARWDPGDPHWHTWTGDGLAGAGVRQLLLASDGTVWALFPTRGLYRFDAQSVHPRATRLPDSGDGWQPRRITAAPDGSIWADGTDRLHVIRYRDHRFIVEQKVVPPNGAGTTLVPSMSSTGVLWSGGPRGLSRLVNGQWQHFQKEDGLLANNVVDVRAVRDDEVWIGYPDEGRVTRARVASSGGLVATHFQRGVCALGMDARQNVWIEMEQGAGMISPNGALRTFMQSDGLLWDDINCNALWQEADGSVLIGTSKGLARYDPTQEGRDVIRPTAILTSAVFGEKDHVGESAPRIDYRDRSFQARFAAPTFRDPDLINCRYRMRGLETKFTETNLRAVRYSSLPAGHYAFEVSCGSSERGWSGLTAYSFTIRSPWWQSWYAELIDLTLAGLLIWALIQFRTKRDRREKERLEIAVAERSSELAKANRELEEASLSDPLTGLRNRRFFHTMIPADASQAMRDHCCGQSRDHRELVFYLIDLDNFKEVNDGYGHDVGDHLLTEIAGRLRGIVRQSDFLIRWGGEEFLIVCRSAERTEAPRMAERILFAIGSNDFDLGAGILLRRTCSVGWAPYPWSQESRVDLSVEEALRLADRGLYQAKSRGRNLAVGMIPGREASRGDAEWGQIDQLPKDDCLEQICTLGPEAGIASSAR